MENLKEVAENLVHLNMIMKADCPIKIENPIAHDWLINFLVKFAEKAVKNCTIPRVIKSVCDQCRFESECRFKAENVGQNCKFFIDKQTVL